MQKRFNKRYTENERREREGEEFFTLHKLAQQACKLFNQNKKNSEISLSSIFDGSLLVETFLFNQPANMTSDGKMKNVASSMHTRAAGRVAGVYDFVYCLEIANRL